MSNILDKWTGFPEARWDTRDFMSSDTNIPINSRLPNSVLYTYDPQTGEAGFNVPRGYNIPKANPVQSEEEAGYEEFDPQIAEAQRVYPIGGGQLSRKNPVALYKEQLETGQISPELYENAPFEYRRNGGEWKELPTLKDYYVKAGGKLLSDDDIVNNIIYGKYGNGDKRRQKLMALGLTADDIERIRGLVNARMYAAQAKPVRPKVSKSRPVNQRQTYQGMPISGKWPR